MITAYRPDVKINARYSVKEAAEILGIHRNTLHNHTIRGNIRAIYSRSTCWPKYTGAEILRFWEETI